MFDTSALHYISKVKLLISQNFFFSAFVSPNEDTGSLDRGFKGLNFLTEAETLFPSLSTVDHTVPRLYYFLEGTTGGGKLPQ